MNLQGKTALITGSSRGIGKAIAAALGRAGCRVAINASRSEEELLRTAKELAEEGISCAPFLADVSDYESCLALFVEIKNTFGEVDILVNNAGAAHIGLFTDMTPNQWQRLLAVDLGSVLNCTHLAVPAMVRKQIGRAHV